MVKIGDIVELMPTDNRNRQLLSQKKKRIWEVIKVSSSTQAFNGAPGISILHRATNHERWVQEDDIVIIEYVDNLEL